MLEEVALAMVSILGDTVVAALFKVLNSSSVSSYRICGGMVLTLIEGGDMSMINDVDIFVVPRDEPALVLSLMSLPVMAMAKDDTPTEHTPGRVHDIKGRLPGEAKHRLDIVFRCEVGPCDWVGIPSCTSGLVRCEGKLMGVIVGLGPLMSKILYVKPKTDAARRAKYASRGYAVVDLA